MMKTIDLRAMRCPMSLIIVKQFLLKEKKIKSLSNNHVVSLVFDNNQAMNDVSLYLEKKGYSYSVTQQDDITTLVVRLS